MSRRLNRTCKRCRPLFYWIAKYPLTCRRMTMSIVLWWSKVCFVLWLFDWVLILGYKGILSTTKRVIIIVTHFQLLIMLPPGFLRNIINWIKKDLVRVVLWLYDYWVGWLRPNNFPLILIQFQLNRRLNLPKHRRLILIITFLEINICRRFWNLRQLI